MKDVFGRELEIGQRVATNCYGGLHALGILTVIGFTEKKVRLKTNDGWILKFPQQVAIGTESNDGINY